MARTTPAAVEAILGDDYNYDGNTDLTPFIASANIIVNRVNTCALAKNPAIVLGDDELELIERWLAAHYYCKMDQLYQSKSTSSASASFQGQKTNSIESTDYGQSAINMDYSGCLSAISKRAFAGGFTAPCNPTVWGG